MTETPPATFRNVPPCGREQRRSLRHLPAAEAIGQLIVLVEGSSWPGIVVNLSLEGAALCLPRPAARGTELDLDLRNLALGFSVRRRFRVTHVSQSLDGFEVIGGVFPASLSQDELQALLW